jgi:LemA protein
LIKLTGKTTDLKGDFMETQWSKLFGFFFVFTGIILICVVFGGYSSLYRSEGRIESSKEFLLDACQKRLDLVPKLLTILQGSEDKATLGNFKNTEKMVKAIMGSEALQQSPLDKEATLKLETSQSALTKELAAIFQKLDQSAGKGNKKELYDAQDQLSFAKVRYNREVMYFETRTKIFPGFIIAKIFGFDKSKYYELSDNSFLDAKNSFGK